MRANVLCTASMNRALAKTDQQHEGTTTEWVRRLLQKEQCVPNGHAFVWNDVTGTAYLYEAAMRYIHMGQETLQQAQTMVGKQAFMEATKSAQYFSFVLSNILPRWTFKPFYVVDTNAHDVYGHYCLARAVAFDAVGEADMTCSSNAQIAAACNASHLYAVAAHLISGDVTRYVQNAHYSVGKMLRHRASHYLSLWDTDDDESGAANAVACLEEAKYRFQLAGKGTCDDELRYATERNQVNYQRPVLPEWSTVHRVSINAIRPLSP